MFQQPKAIRERLDENTLSYTGLAQAMEVKPEYLRHACAGQHAAKNAPAAAATVRQRSQAAEQRQAVSHFRGRR